MTYFKNLRADAKSNGNWMPQSPASLALGEQSQLRVDTVGNLITRSEIYTDAGSYYFPFSGSSLPESFSSFIGTGGSVTVANSKCNVVSGTNTGAATGIYRIADYSPLTLSYTMMISQRIANQDLYAGYGNHPTDPTLDTMFARFHFYGTDNTLVSCETKSSSDTGGTQGVDTQILLPLGMSTSQNLQYRIIHTSRDIRFYIGVDFEHMQLIAINSLQIPDPYTTLYQRVRILNGTSPASSTTMSVDNITMDNKNILDVTATVDSGNLNIGQTVLVSTANSSTTNLTASPATGYIFVGQPEPTLNVADLQVSLKASENCTVYVEQSPDGINWDISDNFNYNHLDTRGFGVNVQAISSYFRVRVQNISTTAATTYFRLQSVLCPVAEPLPRAVSDEGNLKVGIYELEDGVNGKGRFTPMKDLKVTESYRLVGASFGSSNDTAFWTVANSGTGSAAGVANSISTLSSGTTNGGYGQIQSVRTGRFIFAHPHLYRSGIRVPNLSVSGNARRWGAFSTTGTTTPSNGFYFELSPTNVLSCVASNTGTPVFSVASGSFNGFINEFIMDTSVHFYEIVFFLGVVQFFIDDVLVHTMRPTTQMLSGTFTLPVTSTTINAGTSSGTLEVWASIILRMGKEKSAPQWLFSTGTKAITTIKAGAGTLRSVTLGTNTPAGTISFWDSLTNSNQICVLTWTNNQASTTVDFNLDFYTGLSYIVTGGGSQTIVYE